MVITSTNNAKVKMWEKLKIKKYRELYSIFLVEDEHLVFEALNYGLVSEIICIDKSQKFNVDTYYVNDSIMKKISSQVTTPKIVAVCHIEKKNDISDRILLLDNIQDPGNLGTIIRSAAAFNFKTIILSDDSVDLYNPKTIRATEGMIFKINVIRRNILEFLKELDDEYLRVTTNVRNGKDIREISYNKIAIVIGNEGSGVKREISELCDETVNIKMNNIESLNAGVSASILMYEVYHG